MTLPFRSLRILGIALAILTVNQTTTGTKAWAQCYSLDAASGQPWPNGTTAVAVYVHDNPQGTGTSRGLVYALNLDLQSTEIAVRRTLNILNEEVGGAIKLQYGGTTTSSTNINGAIVLRAQECSNDASGTPLAFARAQSASSGGKRVRGQIEFFRKHGNICKPITWFLQEEANQTDIPSVLIHELGHVFYDVGHPNDPSFNCTIGANDMTIMNVPKPPRARVIKDWDREIFQVRHGVRSINSKLYKSARLGAGNWQVAHQVPDSEDVRFTYRPGSLPQNASIRNIGFLRHPATSTFPQLTGGGSIAVARYNLGGFAHQKVGQDASIMRPVAIASRDDSEFLVAYVKRINSYILDSDIGKICYRRSLDSGITYTSEECEESANWQVYRNGLTAAYSSFGDSFIIGFVGDGDYIRLGVVPAIGSTTPAHVTNVPSFQRSWHAPAIACSTESVSDACRVVWEERTNYGCRTGAVATFNPASASITISTPVSSPCMVLYDTPGLVYAGAFYLFVTGGNQTISTYAVPVSDPTFHWFYDGSPWSVPGSFVLSATAAVRAGSGSAQIQAFFVKYN